MIHFVTSNRYKRAEVAALLAGLDVTWTRLTLPRPEGDDLEACAVERARAAFAVLGAPCFAEVSELRAGGETFTGADYKKRLEAEGEAAFHQRIAGPALASVAVALTDGQTERVFRGDLRGELLAAPRGQGGYGWDRYLVPEDTGRTLAEMVSQKSFVNMRLLPYVELADALRGRTFGGVFEAHVTVALEGAAELRRFGEACDRLGVKHIHIVLPRGETRSQPMTGSYHHGVLGEVHAEVLSLARALAADGFTVTRAKIEATGGNRDIPQTDAEAREMPDNYFEFHVKVRCTADTDVEALTALVAAHGAHLSRNARKVRPDGSSDRFVTLRVYHEGKRSADARFAPLRADLRAAGHVLSEPVREYTVYDTNAAVDAGWLSP